MSPPHDAHDKAQDNAQQLVYAEHLRVTGMVHLVRPSCQFDVLVSSDLQKDPVKCDLACVLLGFLSKAYPKIWCQLVSLLPRSHWARTVYGTLCVTIGVISDADIEGLNRVYRGKNTATDVLSFPAIEPEEAHWMGLLNLPVLELGDVVVSLDWACAQVGGFDSQSGGNLEEAVILYLVERVIHGTLHILGIHHDTLSAYNKVIRIQADIMTSLGLAS